MQGAELNRMAKIWEGWRVAVRNWVHRFGKGEDDDDDDDDDGYRISQLPHFKTSYFLVI